jgi:hypothetical protein
MKVWQSAKSLSLGHLGALLLSVCPCAFSQTAVDPTIWKATVTQILQAMGVSPSQAGTLTSVAVGKMTLVGDQPLSGAIKYETSGLSKIRSEFTAPDGLVIRVVNSGEGTIQRPNKAPRRLSRNNTVFEEKLSQGPASLATGMLITIQNGHRGNSRLMLRVRK